MPRFWKSKFFIPFVFAVILVLGIANVAILSAYYSNQNLSTNYPAMKGTVQVFVKDAAGKIVSETKSDTIYSNSYDYIMCALFYDSSACAASGILNNGMWPTAATTVTTTAVLPIRPVYTLTAIALSNAVVGTSGCNGFISSGNGLAPSVATTTHTAATNSIVLTDSWTYTGASVTIYSVCLTEASYQNPSSVCVFGTGSGACAAGSVPLVAASETFTGQTLTTGQSISVAWTLSF
jgi:hypothetical protein